MENPTSLGRRDFLLAGVTSSASSRLLAQETPPKRLRYGIVGSGLRALGTHMPFLNGFVPEVQIAAIADITPEALEKGRSACPGAATYNDHKRMLAEHPELDAVVVVIPNYLHAQVTLDALEAGKHVLVEKPMATRLADADRMISVAAQRKLVLQVGMQARYNEVFRRMADLIREGAIGDVELIVGSLFRGDWNPNSWRYTDPVTGKRTNWRYLTRTAGSSLLEDGIHELDVIHWLAGRDPVRIQAHGGNNVLKDRETIDHAGLLVEFAGGAKLDFSYTTFTPGVTNREILRLFGAKAEMSFEGAWYNARGQGEIVIRPYQRGSGAKAERIAVPYLRPDEEKWGEGGPVDPGSVRQHRAFVQSILKGTPVRANGAVGRDAVHISLAAERSLRTKRALRWDEVEAL